ncbi:uncharacterized protein MKZ38_001943 [Zalerion maritima]|uniref:Chromo domain-containing protein n=1 Tax=Zalerion maritima TaxID=339359 RepID=A0AAD5WTG4_9PEZI|nr:uncharacterized protein MKZ38_001943 [Zalerion maritima]
MDSDQDSIPTTSTQPSEHDEDDEFEVEDILAINDSNPALIQYLVRWKHYPLSRASLEPEENLPDDVMEIWRKKQRKIEKGECEKFDISDWQKAIEDAHDQKEDRRRRREAKRKRLAKKKRPTRTGGAAFGMDDSDNSSAEAVEGDDIPDSMANRRVKDKPKAKVKQKTFGLTALASTTSTPASRKSSTPISKTRQTAQRPTPTRTSSSSSKLQPTQAQGEKKAKSKPRQTPQLGTSNCQKPLPAKPNTSFRTPSSSSTTASASASTLDSRRTTSIDKVSSKPLVDHIQPQATPSNARLPRAPLKKSASIPGPSASSAALSVGSKRITQEMAGELRATKKPTAKKSKPPGNVFTSGKTSKPKTGMVDMIEDPSKAKNPDKLFGRWSIVRKAQLKGRELGDSHVPLGSVPKSLLGPTASTGEQSRREESELFVDPEPQIEDVEQQREHQIQRKLEPDSEPELELEPESSIQPQAPRKRKSVRFADDSLITDEPMSISGSPEPMYIDTSKDAKKTISVGSVIPKIDVVFAEVPNDPHLPWVKAFASAETLEFATVCQVQNVRDRIPLQPLFMGTAHVLFGPSKTRFDKLLVQLERGDLALAMSGSVSMLLYPAQSKSWCELLKHTTTSGLEDSLNYCILQQLDLPPISPLALPSNSTSPGDRRGDLPELMEMYFGWRADQVFPRQAKDAQKPIAFYLLLPRATNVIYTAIGKWITANSASGAEIYTCEDPGGWRSFLWHSAGTLIVHNSCLRLIRSIPSFAEDILDRKIAVIALHDLDTAYGSPTVVFQNRLRMTNIFPSGGAILLTPSFLLTEPKQTLELLLWFQQHHQLEPVASKLGTGWILVGAHGLEQYMLDLCGEQIKLRKDLQDIYTDATVRSLEENKRRVSPEFISKRYDAWKVIRDLQSDRIGRTHEELGGITSAPTTIDANDEQSLVNWFGYWSLSNIHRYRKFYVVGSSEARWNSELGSRVFAIPKFGRRTVSDPDKAFAKEQGILPKGVEIEMDVDDGPEMPTMANVGYEITPPKMLNSQSGQFPVPSDVQPHPDTSKFFGSESALEFQDHLKRLNEKYSLGSSVFWRLYNRPVSWDGDAMQEFFEKNHVDRRDNYERFADWWNYTYSFYTSRAQGSVAFNTYIGLFYTLVDQDWNQHDHIKGLMPKNKRHPWIAVYRPQVPHKRQKWDTDKACDLLIWDPYADRRFQNIDHPTLPELPYMQRKLCQWVHEHTGVKNQMSTLSKVYYGGFEWPECETVHPLDLTITFLENVMQNARYTIPSADYHLVKHGWKILDTAVTMRPARPSPARPVTPPAAVSEPLPRPAPNGGALEASHGVKDGEDSEPPYTADELCDPELRLVFHPPSRNKPRAISKSKCQNLLVEKIDKVKKLKAHAEEIRFDYTPTTRWYKNQVDEGRAYSHIVVGNWETIAKKLLEVEMGRGDASA